MKILNINGLISDLKQGVVSQSDQLKYLIGWLIFNHHFVSSRGDLLKEFYWVQYLFLGIRFLCIIFYYIENKKGDNKDFLTRFIAIDFESNIYFTLYGALAGFAVIPLGMLLYFLIGSYSDDLLKQIMSTKYLNLWVGLFFGLSIVIFKFIWIRSSFKKVAN